MTLVNARVARKWLDSQALESVPVSVAAREAPEIATFGGHARKGTPARYPRITRIGFVTEKPSESVDWTTFVLFIAVFGLGKGCVTVGVTAKPPAGQSPALLPILTLLAPLAVGFEVYYVTHGSPDPYVEGGIVVCEVVTIR